MDAALKQASTQGAAKPGHPEATRARSRRSGSDTLAVFWNSRGVHLGVLRRQSVASHWVSTQPCETVEAFARTLDEGLSQLDFSGSDAVLVLEHPRFGHRYETLPPLSDHAARSFLTNRIDREQDPSDPCLWVAQPMASTKKETAALLHLLPTSLYRALNEEFISRRLDLTRILPVTVPMLLLAGPVEGEKPVLAAAEIGGSVCCTAIAPSGAVLINRILRADWIGEAERIAVEVNRCTLFIKQRHALVVGEVRLLGRPGEETVSAVSKGLPAGTSVTHRAVSEKDWTEALAKVPLRQPVNLLAGYLTHKRQVQLWRKGTIAAAWLGAVTLGLSAWGVQQQTRDQLQHYSQLEANRTELLAERSRLVRRNTAADWDSEAISDITQRGTQMPARILAVIAASAPSAVDITDALVRIDSASGKWQVRLSGQMRADEFSAPEILGTWASQLERTPPNLVFPMNLRVMTPGGAENPSLQRFTLEGGLLEP